LLHFILLMFFNQFQWQLGKVCAMLLCLLIRGEERHMEDVVNLPGWR
jgi:hypothetical protein